MFRLVWITVSLLLVCGVSTTLSYDLVNQVIDDGGAKMTSSGYVVRGSFGQPTAGKIASTDYVAYIGFWHPYPAGPGIEEGFFSGPVPLVFSLSQNFPNPTTSSTTIKYGLATEVKVDLAVYNSAGQRTQDLVRETQQAGFYIVKWDLREASEAELPNGVYFYRMEAGDFIKTRKMVVVR